MNILKTFKNWIKKDKPVKELIPLKDVKDEVVGLLSYAIDVTDIEIYTYYENDYLTIEVKGNSTNYSLIKEDFEQFLEYFEKKYDIYDSSFIRGRYIDKKIKRLNHNIGYENVPLEFIENLDQFEFIWIDIYIDKYKK